jgi:hypothetical protein
MAVRAAASLCVHLARSEGGCTLLSPGDRRPLQIDSELRAWPVAHARLALVEAGDATPSLATTRNIGAILWVTGRGGRPPRAGRGPTAPISHLVSPSPLAGLPVRFTVAGCHGQSLSGASRRRAAPRRVAA